MLVVLVLSLLLLRRSDFVRMLVVFVFLPIVVGVCRGCGFCLLGIVLVVLFLGILLVSLLLYGRYVL